MFNNIKSKLLKAKNNNSPLGIVMKGAIILIIIIISVSIIKNLYNKYNNYKNSKPWLFKGTKNAKKRIIIPQDPANENSITLQRSKNEKNGLEFSYCFWMNIDDWSYKYGKWKHILHKGNDKSWPLRSPGIWLHPKKNTLRIYQNTFYDIGEFVDIVNIPIKKWFLVSICIKQKILDIYINGNLVKRKELKGLPKQNYGDIYINAFNGFSGYMSNIRYWNYYINFSEIRYHLLKGPSIIPCVDKTDGTPPYLSSEWWNN
jgi:hypothetical protein